MALPSGLQRTLALDGLRGLAALTVLVWHVVDRLSHGTLEGDGVLTHAMGDSGKVAVSLFFVLSGFLLARPLLAWLLGSGSGRRCRASCARGCCASCLRGCSSSWSSCRSCSRACWSSHRTCCRSPR